ncbi:MAG: hypothetical protein AAF333_11535 [Planctomycetota bacterium]
MIPPAARPPSRSSPAFRAPRLRAIAAGAALLLLAGATGCNNAKLRDAQAAYWSGNLAGAGAKIDAFVASDGEGGNRVIAYLEQGSIRRAQGDYAASNESFAVVDAALTRIDNSPEVSLSGEALAAVTNLNTLPYRGYHYDRVMLNTFRALNYLEMGERDAARVELRRAYERQREAVAANAERLEKAEEEAKKSKNAGNYDADRAQNDPGFQNNLDAQYAGLDRYAAYGDYVNPFTEWMQGVYYRGEAADGSDLEWSRKAFERVLGMSPDNDYLRQDYDAANRIAGGGPIEPTTYVIFATGTAPMRGEVRIDIPLFLVDGSVDYVGANFPKLVENPAYVRQLQVRTDTGTYPTQLLADMDQVVGREFKNELPIVITKTLIAAGTKATIAYALRKAAEENGGEGNDLATFVRIATTVYQAAVNRADLRTWATLPKQFQIARLPTPGPSESNPRNNPYPGEPTAGGSGTINLVSTGFPPVEVELLPGRINVVYVRSINPSTPFLISQFSLGQGAPSWQSTASAAPGTSR